MKQDVFDRFKRKLQSITDVVYMDRVQGKQTEKGVLYEKEQNGWHYFKKQNGEYLILQLREILFIGNVRPNYKSKAEREKDREKNYPFRDLKTIINNH